MRFLLQTILLLALLVPFAATGQDYRMKQFRVEDGLPSNVIKAITQDSHGFFWIATDEGLVKFDGVSFTSYKSAMHSQYAKGFLQSRSGQLYVYGDLDLIEIINEIDTVRFRSVLNGTRNPTDSTLWFPKAMFEDKQDRLWISEPQSVVCLRNGRLTRFQFGIEDRSPQFLRSFTFFEDNLGFLYAVSYSGNVYMFDGDELTFIKEDVTFPAAVNDVRVRGDKLWIVSGSGLYAADLLANGGFSKPVLKTSALAGSYLSKVDSASSLLSTFEQDHYLVDNKSFKLERLPFGINTVNSTYVSAENDIWLASNEGLVLLQKNLFHKIGSPDQLTFVEAITEDTARHIVYYSTASNLYSVPANGPYNSTKILTIPKGYFQSLIYNKHGLWAANAYVVYLINDGKIQRSWNFESKGRFIHDIMMDKAGNLWLSQAGNRRVISIRSNFEIESYPVPLEREGIVNCVREANNGVYLTSNGTTGYLFFKSSKDSVFKNISVPVTFETRGDFNVTDLVITDSIIWMATSEGLVRSNGKSLQQVDLGDVYSKLPVKSVALLESRYLVFNNSFGLFRYDVITGDFWRYDDSNGLPSNTIPTRGLYIDHHARVWVGTSMGVGVSSHALMNEQLTLTPQFVGAEVNGVPKRFMGGLKLPFGSYFTLNISCISFPTDKIQMQFRIVALDSVWKTTRGSELTFTDLPAGNYTIETRAKKNGGYVWSESSWMKFQVQKPFWQQTWFTASALLLIAFIAWSSFALAAYINKKRRYQLELLVSQRTAELKRINEELSMRNSELDRFVYSTSHDLSAPLKSIRGLIMVASMEKPNESQLSYLQMMDKSVKKLEAFIADVINYSRNTRTAVQRTPINITLFIQQILDDHQYAPNYGKIKFTIEDYTNSIFMSDEMRLKIIFNNLVSNAIKFHFIANPEGPYVTIISKEEVDAFVFVVEDNGMGIHPQLKDRIFDMFFRATENVSGSGLGLYILRETVIKLGGEVNVDTELGVGTTFTIRLPK